MGNNEILKGLDSVLKGLDSVIHNCKKEVDKSMKNLTGEQAQKMAEIMNSSSISKDYAKAKEQLEELQKCL